MIGAIDCFSMGDGFCWLRRLPTVPHGLNTNFDKDTCQTTCQSKGCRLHIRPLWGKGSEVEGFRFGDLRLGVQGVGLQACSFFFVSELSLRSPYVEGDDQHGQRDALMP